MVKSKPAKHSPLSKFEFLRKYLFFFILIPIPFLAVLPGSAVPRTTSCGTIGTLQNGNFENFTIGTVNSPSGSNFWHGYAGGPNMFLFLPDDEDDTPNGLSDWKTTATDDTIELQQQISSYTSYTNSSNVTNSYSPARSGVQTGSLTGSNYFDLYGPQPASGTYWAELNANQSAALYQDIAFSGGSNVFWSLKHRGRYFSSGSNYNRTDQMRVYIGAVGSLAEQTSIRKFAPTNSDKFSGIPTFNTTSTSVSTIQTSLADGWNMYQGQYTVPGSGNQTIRFQFESVSSGSGGNLLDDIEFTPFIACPVTRSVTFGTPDALDITSAGVSYGVDQTLSTTSSASNPNGASGNISTSGNTITFTPTAAGNGQTVDYTASMTFSGTTYNDEARITYNVSATVPGAPTSLSATPSGTQVVLNWTAPTNNGGVAISDYVVEFQEGSGSWQTFSDGVGSSTSATITGLNGSSNYNFRVSAKNDGSGYSGPGTTGTSAASSTLAVNAWLPGAPTLNTPTSPSSTSVNLTWSAPGSTGLSAITSYLLEYRLSSDTTWTSINTGNTNTSRTVSGLTASQTYVFRISATNSQGTGTASSTQTIALSAGPRTTSCGTIGTLQNGGFESPTVTDNSAQYQYFNTVTAQLSWKSTNNSVELWRNPTPVSGRDAFEGSQLAELNSDGFGGLYQDITTTPGQRILWQLKHRGRSGTESMRVLIGTPPPGTTSYGATSPATPLPGTLTIQQQNGVDLNIEDGTSSWGAWSGNYLVPDGQTTTRFLFVSFNPSSGGSGNLLDDIIFEPFLACPVERSVTFGTPDVLNVLTTDGVTYGAGHSLSSTQNAINPSGSVGTVSTSSSAITFTPNTAGSNQTLDYTISVTSAGTTYTDEARVTYNVSATVPGAPTSLSATPSGTQVVLNWTAPTNNGGVAISDYVVEFQEGSGSWQTFSDGVGSSTSATITGLTGSNNYNFRVSAKNDGSGYPGPGTTGTGNTSSTLAVNAWICSDLDEFNNISGLILWLRADCVNGTPTQPSDGSSITRWEDLSGSNNDATQTSGQLAPTFQSDSGNLINGLPVLNFTRSSDSSGTVLQVNGVDIRAGTLPDVSIFAVYKTRQTGGSATDNLGVWGNDNGSWDRFFISRFQNFDNDGLISLGPVQGNTTSGRLPGAGTNLSTRLLTAVYDGNVVNGTNSGPSNNSKIYFGGNLEISFTDSTDATLALERLYLGWDGNDNPFRGDIAEFIVFNNALTDALPTINNYLNDKYNLGLAVATNLPDVILVHPLATTINVPPLTLSNSTNAMICFSQVSNSGGTALSGSPTISISRSTNTSGVTENTATNLWRYGGTRSNVQTQIENIRISGTGGGVVSSSGSKWLRVHVTSATSAQSDCEDSQVNKVVEIRTLGVETTRRFGINVD